MSSCSFHRHKTPEYTDYDHLESLHWERIQRENPQCCNYAVFSFIDKDLADDNGIEGILTSLVYF